MAANPLAELTASDVLSEHARATIDRAREQFLLHLATPVLRHEQSLRDGAFPFASATPRWDASVIATYPLLANAIDTVTRDWHRAQATLAARFAHDFPHLRIDAIAPFCSDPHDGQQTVAILSLSDGRLLVYKPRSLAMEGAFGDLVEWANERGFPWPLRRVRVLDREDYGWMEHVANTPCRNEFDVRCFYARAGGLLCLLALLQATDIHHENLIASRDQPVIVDLETIAHPRKTPIDFASAMLETGFLPTNSALDFSALGATEPFDTPFAHRVPLRENVATIDGRSCPAAMYVADVMRGFASMFELLLTHDAREVLLRFDGLRVREIRRASNDYGLLLQESRHPRFLRDAAQRRQLFERLRGITDDELAALARFDVPCFTTRCNAAVLIAAYERLSPSVVRELLGSVREALQRREKWPTKDRSDPS